MFILKKNIKKRIEKEKKKERERIEKRLKATFDKKYKVLQKEKANEITKLKNIIRQQQREWLVFEDSEQAMLRIAEKLAILEDSFFDIPPKMVLEILTKICAAGRTIRYYEKYRDKKVLHLNQTKKIEGNK